MLGGEERGEDLPHQTERTRIGFYLLALVAFVGWSYIFLRSDLFLIKDIEASGLKTIDQVELAKFVFRDLDAAHGWRPWDPRHSWFIDEKQLTNELMQSLFAESVKIEKPQKNILRLILKERPHQVVIMTQGSPYWMSLDGSLQQELNSAERKDVSQRLTGKLTGTSDDPPIILSSFDDASFSTSSKTLVPPRRVRTWIELATDLNKAGIDYRALEPKSTVTSTSIEILLPDASKRLFMEIEGSISIASQINAYKAFLQSKDLTKGDYRLIDLRIPNRIYLRP